MNFGTVTILGFPMDVAAALVIFGIVAMIGLLSALATDTSSAWYQWLRKPEWQPPARLFGPVWMVIYTLLAISAIIVWNSTSSSTSALRLRQGDLRTSLMLLFAINGALNLAWSFLFFRGRSPVVAGIDITGLLLTIALIMYRVWPVSEVAALLLLPYLLWVGFAAALNWTIVRMN